MRRLGWDARGPHEADTLEREQAPSEERVLNFPQRSQATPYPPCRFGERKRCDVAEATGYDESTDDASMNLANREAEIVIGRATGN